MLADNMTVTEAVWQAREDHFAECTDNFIRAEIEIMQGGRHYVERVYEIITAEAKGGDLTLNVIDYGTFTVKYESVYLDDRDGTLED